MDLALALVEEDLGGERGARRRARARGVPQAAGRAVAVQPRSSRAQAADREPLRELQAAGSLDHPRRRSVGRGARRSRRDEPAQLRARVHARGRRDARAFVEARPRRGRAPAARGRRRRRIEGVAPPAASAPPSRCGARSCATSASWPASTGAGSSLRLRAALGDRGARDPRRAVWSGAAARCRMQGSPLIRSHLRRGESYDRASIRSITVLLAIATAMVVVLAVEPPRASTAALRKGPAGARGNLTRCVSPAARHEISTSRGLAIASPGRDARSVLAADPARYDRSSYPCREARTVAILVYDGVELLDFAGPGEVFAAAGRVRRLSPSPRPSTPVTSQGFLEVQPEYSLATAPRPDILVAARRRGRDRDLRTRP